MLIHDVSDIPLDLLKIFMALDWEIMMVRWTSTTYTACKCFVAERKPCFVYFEQYISYAATLVAWAYFRIWILSAVILRTVIFGPTTSFIFPCEGGGKNPQCATGFYAEMSAYVTLIGVLWVLHLLWFRKMLRKGYRLLCGTDGAGSSSKDSASAHSR
jgi:hypothetical protein